MIHNVQNHMPGPENCYLYNGYNYEVDNKRTTKN